jgi:hypothetical protein
MGTLEWLRIGGLDGGWFIGSTRGFASRFGVSRRAGVSRGLASPRGDDPRCKLVFRLPSLPMDLPSSRILHQAKGTVRSRIDALASRFASLARALEYDTVTVVAAEFQLRSPKVGTNDDTWVSCTDWLCARASCTGGRSTRALCVGGRSSRALCTRRTLFRKFCDRISWTGKTCRRFCMSRCGTEAFSATSAGAFCATCAGAP